MKKYWLSVKTLFQRFLGRIFATDIPVGLTDFKSFSNKVLDTYSIPNLPSYHHAIASMVQHLGPQTTAVKKYWLARSIRKAMCNQVAFEVIQQIKEEQKAKDALNDKAVQVEGV